MQRVLWNHTHQGLVPEADQAGHIISGQAGVVHVQARAVKVHWRDSGRAGAVAMRDAALHCQTRYNLTIMDEVTG